MAINLIITIFTFHNVSINSLGGGQMSDELIIFTFHNVSINSRCGCLS